MISELAQYNTDTGNGNSEQQVNHVTWSDHVTEEHELKGHVISDQAQQRASKKLKQHKNKDKDMKSSHKSKKHTQGKVSSDIKTVTDAHASSQDSGIQLTDESPQETNTNHVTDGATDDGHPEERSDSRI